MTQNKKQDKKVAPTPGIDPSMTVLDVVAAHGATQTVFKRYDAMAGECICCHSLFDTLDQMAEKYGLDLAALLTDLRNA
ncbi:MAG: hypothetical protein JEZ12_07810 [Desulfobacterium sp.]|nr:hypothetical protein [Desulfobacterium sp.]